jgi:hypothetical protein
VKKITLVFMLLLSGCNTISATAMKEVDEAAVIGDRIYKEWETVEPEKKKAFVYRFTRALYNVKADVHGEDVPADYLAVPGE